MTKSPVTERHGSDNCNVGKFLVVPTFVARRLQVRLDARAPNGESWIY